MNREKHLETILVLILALGIFYWIYQAEVLLIIAAILSFIGVFIPFLAGKIHWAWMKLAHMMGFVMSKVLLSVVYILILLPLSFFSKVFGSKNGVVMKSGNSSYYTDRNFTYSKKSMENVW